jgi:hypothetical protein
MLRRNLRELSVPDRIRHQQHTYVNSSYDLFQRFKLRVEQFIAPAAAAGL